MFDREGITLDNIYNHITHIRPQVVNTNSKKNTTQGCFFRKNSLSCERKIKFPFKIKSKACIAIQKRFQEKRPESNTYSRSKVPPYTLQLCASRESGDLNNFLSCKTRELTVLASGDYNHYESGENRQNQSKRNSHYYNQTKVPKICADQ